MTNSAFFLIEALISFWYTPFLLRKLGSDLFGFIPLANSITNYFSIVLYSLDISLGRNITIELEKGNTCHANQIFNTNRVITLFLIFAAVPIGIVLVIFIPALFTVPIGRERDVQLLFISIIIAFLLGTYGMNYSLATFAKNRFDLKNLVALGARIIQVLIIVGLFRLSNPNLIYVGVGALCAALFNLLGDYYLWRILLPTLKVRWKDFSKKSIKILFDTGIWSFVYQAGFILFLNVDILIANRTLDLSMVGIYGALLVIPKNLRNMSVAIGGVWRPLILSKYSQSDSKSISEIMNTSIKLTGLVLGLIIGLVCGLAEPFLRIWLGPSIQNMSGILVMMVLPLTTNLLAGSFSNIHVSYNKLKFPALMTVGLALLNLFLAIYLAPHYGLIGIIIAGIITLTLNYSFFAPIYAAKIMNLSWWHYMPRLGMILITTLSVFIVSYLLSETIYLSSYSHLIISSGIISIGYFFLIYFLVLSSTEKKMVRRFLDKVTGNNHNNLF
ncbi:MAG: lipopolysaccharide biosynthesis protein [Chloroflexi bacterium]|nr:lipopolysaccharide biosynthesis protein [Chloroflexota bacterium]